MKKDMGNPKTLSMQLTQWLREAAASAPDNSEASHYPQNDPKQLDLEPLHPGAAGADCSMDYPARRPTRRAGKKHTKKRNGSFGTDGPGLPGPRARSRGVPEFPEKSAPGLLGLALTPLFKWFFVRAHLKGVPVATLRHLGANLVPNWAILAVLGGPTWGQVGSKLGPDLLKIGFLKDFVDHLQGARHHIHFLEDLG